MPLEYVPDTSALWHAAGLTQPWNDPDADQSVVVLGKFFDSDQQLRRSAATA